MNKTEDIMRFLCRISSIAVIGMFIYMFYLIYQLIFVYGDISFFTIGAVILALPSIVFYFPFFYYAWFEKIDSIPMKFFTKVITIFMGVIFIVSFVSYGVEGNLATDKLDFLYLALLMVAFVPLFYFGWRKK